MTKKSKKILKLTGILVVIIIFGILIFKLMPWFISLANPVVRDEFKTYISSLGWKGAFVMLGIQILQVVIAVFPGEPVELLAGIIYGTWGGLLLCMVGLTIGTCIIFYSVRALGRGFVEWMFSKEKVQKLSFLNDNKKLEMLTFILFFIPGTPKDILTYVAPLTKIRPRDFFIISICARIPSIITSTYAGQTIIDGEWWKTLGMFLLMGIIGIAGILVNNSIMDKNSKK